MKFKHFRAVTRKEIFHILRDPYTLFTVLFSPVLMLLIWAYSLTVDLKYIPIAVLDQDKSQVSRQFIQLITAGEDLELYAYASSMDEIDDLLMRGEIKAAVTIAPGFAEQIFSLKGAPMQIIIDGTEPESGGFAVEHIGMRAEDFINEILAGQLRSMGIHLESFQPIDLRVRTWFNPGLKPRNDLIPGLISMVLGLPAMSVAMTIAHEREHHTLEQLLATPIGRTELLLGKMFPYLLVGVANVIMIPLAAMAWFHIPFNGNFLLFIFLSIIFLFAMLSMGMIMGVFMRSQAAALALSFLVIFFPGFFMTGIFFPIASMPEIVRLEALGLPGTHYAIITRGVFLTGAGLETLWSYAVMLFGLGIVFTAIAALFFKKKLA